MEGKPTQKFIHVKIYIQKTTQKYIHIYLDKNKVEIHACIHGLVDRALYYVRGGNNLHIRSPPPPLPVKKYWR